MALIAAGLVVLAITPVVRRLATSLGVVDHPDVLKVHDRPVAYLGGLAVLVGLAGPLAASRSGLFLPLGLALLLGIADDVADLPPMVRLAGEACVGASAVAVLPTSPSLMGGFATVVAVVAVLNAVNLLDGLDGLASSVSAISALGFAALLESPDRSVALALAGALAGFLVWNRPPASIYLGDGGSYLVGTLLALLLCLTVANDRDVASSASALLFLAVPVADTTVAIVRRKRAGRPLLMGDRGHIYDQLVDRGWSPSTATLACIAAQAILVAVGLATSTLAGPSAVAVVLAVVLLVGGMSLWTFTSRTSWAT